MRCLPQCWHAGDGSINVINEISITNSIIQQSFDMYHASYETFQIFDVGLNNKLAIGT